MSFKDKVEGNELDLSLNELTEVPVKLLANTPKATHLDLSCNRIQVLPNDFATLTHLVKIDLSRNKLVELPHNFGNLVNLQYLDLDKNELRNLPVSFCRLKNLQWLDLKDNPLDPKLKAVAGNCLDKEECQQCAKKIVMYMQSLDSNMEREKQKKLKEVREKEAIEKAKVEKELEEKRKLRKLEKERRKAQTKAKMEEKMKEDDHNTEKNDYYETENKNDDIREEKKGVHWFMQFLLVCIILAIVIYFSVASKVFSLQNISLSGIKDSTGKYLSWFIENSIKFLRTSGIPFIISVKASLMKNIHSIMVYISNTAADIELFLSDYLI